MVSFDYSAEWQPYMSPPSLMALVEERDGDETYTHVKPLGWNEDLDTPIDGEGRRIFEDEDSARYFLSCKMKRWKEKEAKKAKENQP